MGVRARIAPMQRLFKRLPGTVVPLRNDCSLNQRVGRGIGLGRLLYAVHEPRPLNAALATSAKST
jgi:hypothetical protein